MSANGEERGLEQYGPLTIAALLDREIPAAEARVVEDGQRAEVGAKFLRRARAHAFAGELVLAVRVREAGLNVLNEVNSD